MLRSTSRALCVGGKFIGNTDNRYVDSCFIKGHPFVISIIHIKNTNEDEIFILRISMKQNTTSPALPWDWNQMPPPGLLV